MSYSPNCLSFLSIKVSIFIGLIVPKKPGFLLQVKGRAELFTFLFFSGKQTRVTMANLTEAEKISHYWAKQTVTAISWTEGLTFLVALFILGFNIWTHFAEEGEEEKRSERADARSKQASKKRCRR